MPYLFYFPKIYILKEDGGKVKWGLAMLDTMPSVVGWKSFVSKDESKYSMKFKECKHKTINGDLKARKPSTRTLEQKNTRQFSLLFLEGWSVFWDKTHYGFCLNWL